MNLGGKVRAEKRKGWLRCFCALVLLVATVLETTFGWSLQTVYAEEDDRRPDYRIQVSPAHFDLEDLKPGQKVTETFEVQNTGLKTFDFTLFVAPYSVSDENYTVDYETETKYTDLAEWVTLSEYKGTVEPNSVYWVEATIQVPKDVPAGGQYAVILAQLEVPEDSGTTVLITRQVGIVMYSNVEGVTRNGGKVLENKVPGVLFAPPITVSSLIENTGNTHVVAEYILQVFPLFSDEEVYTNEDKPETRTILPETKRYNTISWESSPQLGIFRVRQTVKILEETSVTEKIVLICPIWFMFTIVLLLFCVVFWIVNRTRGRRKGNESEKE